MVFFLESIPFDCNEYQSTGKKLFCKKNILKISGEFFINMEVSVFSFSLTFLEECTELLFDRMT